MYNEHLAILKKVVLTHAAGIALDRISRYQDVNDVLNFCWSVSKAMSVTDVIYFLENSEFQPVINSWLADVEREWANAKA